MKKIILALAFVLLAVPAFAVNVDTYISANTVTYSTTGVIVTFNTVANNVMVACLPSSTGAVHVALNGEYIGWNHNRTVYMLPAVASYNTIKLLPGDSISMDMGTNKIGYIGEGSGQITYIVTSDKAAL